MTLFEALTGGAFDRLNWQHSREFDHNFSKSQMPGGLPGGGWAVLELTGTLATGRSDMHCKIKESLLIRDLKPALHDNVGSEKLHLYY